MVLRSAAKAFPSGTAQRWHVACRQCVGTADSAAVSGLAPPVQSYCSENLAEAHHSDWHCTIDHGPAPGLMTWYVCSRGHARHGCL